MRVDFVGPERRGLAMGLNEFAGYLALAASAAVTSEIAAQHGLRPYPFVLGAVLVCAGLAASTFWVRDTLVHAAKRIGGAAAGAGFQPPGVRADYVPRPRPLGGDPGGYSGTT